MKVTTKILTTHIEDFTNDNESGLTPQTLGHIINDQVQDALQNGDVITNLSIDIPENEWIWMVNSQQHNTKKK